MKIFIFCFCVTFLCQSSYCQSEDVEKKKAIEDIAKITEKIKKITLKYIEGLSKYNTPNQGGGSFKGRALEVQVRFAVLRNQVKMGRLLDKYNIPPRGNIQKKAAIISRLRSYEDRKKYSMLPACFNDKNILSDDCLQRTAESFSRVSGFRPPEKFGAFNSPAVSKKSKKSSTKE